MDNYQVVSAELPNGATLRIVAEQGGGAQDVAWNGPFDFDRVRDVIEGLAEMVQTAVTKVRPDSVEVELGLDISVESGKLTALLVKGDAGASLKITLGWGGNN